MIGMQEAEQLTLVDDDCKMSKFGQSITESDWNQKERVFWALPISSTGSLFEWIPVTNIAIKYNH
jgi:hypothetical protein